jgi:hypothetical protein
MSFSKLNPKVHHKIVSAINAGAYQSTAAQQAGVAKQTMVAWMERGAMEEARIEEGFEPLESERIYLLFKQDVEIARARSEIQAVKNIKEAGNNGTWQAAAWYLERSFPQRWSRGRELEEVPETEEAASPDEAMNKLLQRLDALAERQHES